MATSDQKANVGDKRNWRSRFFTILGSGIVLTTFVVKDAVRDNLKDKKDAIAAAESSFQLESKLNAIQINLRDTRNGVQSAQDAIEKLRSKTVKHQTNELGFPIYTAGEVREMGVSLHKDLNATWSQYTDLSKSLNKLLDSMGSPETYRMDLNAIQTKALGATKNWDHDRLLFAYAGLATAFTRIFTDDRSRELEDKPETRKTLEDAADDMRRTQDTLSGLVNDVYTLQGKVVKAADDELAIRESRYETATHWSYALYALGWCLTLMGHLFNVPELGAQE